MESKGDRSSNKTLKSNRDGGVTAIDGAAKHSLRSDAASPVSGIERLFTRFLHWLYPEKRKAARHSYPPIVSYLGAAQSTRSYQVADISVAGFYMLTIERWLPGTEIPVTLERTDLGGTGFGKSITLLSTVVRTGPTGVGFSFALTDSEGSLAVASEGMDSPHGAGATLRDMERFLEGLELSEFNVPELERAS
jgi:hypothetical protein